MRRLFYLVLPHLLFLFSINLEYSTEKETSGRFCRRCEVHKKKRLLKIQTAWNSNTHKNCCVSRSAKDETKYNSEVRTHFFLKPDFVFLGLRVHLTAYYPLVYMSICLFESLSVNRSVSLSFWSADSWSIDRKKRQSTNSIFSPR